MILGNRPTSSQVSFLPDTYANTKKGHNVSLEDIGSISRGINVFVHLSMRPICIEEKLHDNHRSVSVYHV